MILTFFLNKISIEKKLIKKLILLILILIVGVFLELIGFSLILPIIHQIFSDDKANIFSQKLPLLGELLSVFSTVTLLILIVFVYLIKSIYLIFSTYFNYKLIHDFVSDILLKTFEAFSKKSYIEYVQNDNSYFMDFTLQKIKYFTSYITAFLTLIVEGIIILSIFSFLLIIDFFGSLFVIIFFLSFFLMIYKISKNFLKKLGKTREVNDKNYSEIILETVNGFKTNFLFNRLERNRKIFYDYCKLKYRINTKYNTINQMPRQTFEFITIMAIVFYCVLSVYLNKSNIEIISSISVFSFASVKIIPSINKIMIAFQNINYFEPATKKIIEYIDSLSKDEKNESIFVEKIDKIELKDILLKYKNKSILDGLYLKINKGDKIGIYADSGSGKTSIVSLLVGLVKQTKGQVLINGIESDKISWSSLISKIVFLDNDPYFFNESLLNNITISDKKLELVESDIKSSLEKSYVEEFYKENLLEKKINSNGQEFSSGQAQRLNLARLFYKKNPELIILDEPTSSIDKKKSKLIIKNIFSTFKESTIILISHHLPDLKFCGRIYTLDNKKLILSDQKNI